jgi:hypothetical protein
MSNKVVLSGLALLFSISSNAFADRCVGSVVNGQCYGTMVPSLSSDNSGYYGSSGSRYQYDLSNPIDRQNYGVDTGAQMRDMYNYDRYYDQGLGQFGGGIYND